MKGAFSCPVPWTLLLKTRFLNNKYSTQATKTLGQCDQIESISESTYTVTMKTQIANFQLLANFNKWTNEKIINSCKKLTETEYKKDREAFFSSIHGTLNHLLVVDRAYIFHIEGKDHGLKSLDQILYENLFQLEKARIEEDKRLVDLVNNLLEESINKEITYNGFETGKTTYTINTILITLFNHQTHHRGQIHNMLSQAGIKPPQIDIPDFIETRNKNKG